MAKRVKMLVTFNLPRTYGVKEIKEYMRSAINSWSGEFHPDDELFRYDWNLSFGSVEPIKEPSQFNQPVPEKPTASR